MALPSGPAVVLTREPADNRALHQALSARGVPVREIPCLATRFVRPERLPKDQPAAVTFSSRRAVRACEQLAITTEIVRPGSGTLVAAVGPATAKELAAAGVAVDLVADPPTGAELGSLLIARLAPGSQVVVVRGDLRAGAMDAALSRAGMRLEPLVVYRNVDPDVPACEPFRVAAVFIASPSAARRLLEKNSWMKKYNFLAIGPTTASELAGLGVERIETAEASFDGWLESLHRAYLQAAAKEEI